MSRHQKIDYVEFPTTDIAATKAFFTEVFGWTFEDFGEEYTAFYDEGLNGGFFQSDLTVSTDKGSALVVFYSDILETTQAKIKQAGGTINKPIFSFPGGRRFHFISPSGNEFAVWADS
ncbi:MAG: VOC family protein [Cyanobacteria bacterium J06560_6]